MAEKDLTVQKHLSHTVLNTRKLLNSALIVIKQRKKAPKGAFFLKRAMLIKIINKNAIVSMENRRQFTRILFSINATLDHRRRKSYHVSFMTFRLMVP